MTYMNKNPEVSVMLTSGFLSYACHVAIYVPLCL